MLSVIPCIHSPTTTYPPLPMVGAFSAHIGGDLNHVSRYKSNVCWQLGWIGKLFLRTRNEKSLNIPGLAKWITRLDLLLPDSQIGALGPPLYSAIIHGLLHTNMLTHIINKYRKFKMYIQESLHAHLNHEVQMC